MSNDLFFAVEQQEPGSLANYLGEDVSPTQHIEELEQHVDDLQIEITDLNAA